MVDLTAFQRRFLERLAAPWDLSRLFDYLPDTYFYAKDLRGRFILVNEALAAMFGLSGPEAMVGKTDRDFSPPDLADRYTDEDRRVIRTGRPVVHQAWLIPDVRGELKWYLSSKIPLAARNGRVIGVAGVMRDVEKAGDLFAPYRTMETVTSFLFTHYAEKINFHQLAGLASLSLSQLDRRFKRLFQLTPQQFLLRIRINAACRMLVASDRSILEIALRNGFYDQSYFTKHFRRRTGVTPTTYRRRYRRAPQGTIETAEASAARGPHERSASDRNAR